MPSHVAGRTIHNDIADTDANTDDDNDNRQSMIIL